MQLVIVVIVISYLTMIGVLRSKYEHHIDNHVYFSVHIYDKLFLRTL